MGGAGAQWAPFSAWSPLPRRSVMGAAHWAASPEPAGESAPVGDGEGQPKVAPRPKIGKVTSGPKTQQTCGVCHLSGGTSGNFSGTSESLLPLGHLSGGTNGGSRIKPGFFLYLTLLISLARGNGFCAVPRGGHPSPFFCVWEGRGLRVSPAGSVGPKRCPPGTRTLATPLGPWSAAPHLASFLKKT